MTLPPFETVVRQHGPAVLRVCRSMLPGHDADDAWSATFLSALQVYPSLERTANIEAWLVTIAHRRIIDLLRARSQRAVPVESVPEGRPADPSEPADDALWDAVRALPAKQRQCVAYRYIADLSYRQIAQIVGGTEAAARRSAADGIRALRSTYSKDADHD